MIFREHSDLKGKHAFLSPSKGGWDLQGDSLLASRERYFAAPMGTAIHELADDFIKKGIKISKQDKHLIRYELLKKGIPDFAIDTNRILETLVPYVNDAIGFGMTTEQVLYAFADCYGTTDAILYEEKTHFLRIHDLKTGETPADMNQLVRYAGIFCFEYKIDTAKISNELRIYQKGDIYTYTAQKGEIDDVISYISYASTILNNSI